ncbi:MAG: sugar transferase [Candidatus Fermentibacteraceae bacterium]|nr:sugar transferase [Candidatus Fermentibacteraceae bacterium]
MKFVPVRRADRVLSVLLVFADAIAIPVAFVLTWFLRTSFLRTMLPEFHHSFNTYIMVLPVVALLWLISFARTGLYMPKRYLGSLGELQKLMKALLYLAVALMAASYLVRMDYSRIMLFMFIGISIPVAAVTRFIGRRIAQIIAPIAEVSKILVVGTGEVASRVISALLRLPGKAPEIIGVVSPGDTGIDEFEGIPIVASLSDLVEQINILKVDEVFFAAPELDRSEMLSIISNVTGNEVHFRLVTDLFEIAISGTDLDDLVKLPIIEIGYGEPGILHKITKRTTDILISLFMAILLFPLMAVLYLILLITGKGSPIFKQRRVGLKGKEFTLLKFRTMKPDSSEYEVAPVSMDDTRVTRTGKFLRRTSLDELPQLFNVIRGEMSLVGPRPEMTFIVKEYNAWQRHRLDVKPGLTGMWQIMGRKELPLHDNLEYDYYYIRNQSLMLDFTILMKTLVTIFRGRGAY